mgnify:FL=1|tara:strand:- start:483 stop:677 length:195 start_codon:yes stop_codon:yes gene_type:complete
MADPQNKNNLDKSFDDEFDSELEEMVNRKEPVVGSIDEDDDNEELREWRMWALSYENDEGDVID